MGHIQSKVPPSHCCSAPSLLPAMAWSLCTHQAIAPNPPFSFPEVRPRLGKTPLSQSRGIQWARSALCLAVSNRPTRSPLRARCPLGGTVGSHGQPLANGGRCQPACRAGGCQEWGALLQRGSQPPRLPAGTCEPVLCHRKQRQSLWVSLLPPGRRKGVCPAGWQQRGEVGEVLIGPGLT